MAYGTYFGLGIQVQTGISTGTYFRCINIANGYKLNCNHDFLWVPMGGQFFPFLYGCGCGWYHIFLEVWVWVVSYFPMGAYGCGWLWVWVVPILSRLWVRVVWVVSFL